MKATFFLGRIHHALKLIPIMRGFANENYHIDVLIANNSINIDPTTEYLHKFGFTNVHHSMDYLLASGRLSEALFEETNYLSTNEIFGWCPPQWVISSVRDLCQDSIGFDEYLKINKPDIVFGLHENNFWVKLLFYLAQKRNIPTYSLMEGIILDREERDLGKYSIGTDYTTTLFSWSDDDSGYYSDSEKIHPAGPVHLDEVIKLINDNGLDYVRDSLKQRWSVDRKLVVFAPPRLDLYQGDFHRALLSIAKWTQEQGHALLVKLHPFQGGLDVIEAMVKPFNHVRISADADSVQYLAAADVIVTQTSTVAIEGLCLGVPVAGYDLDYVGLEQLVRGMALIEGNNIGALTEIMKMDVNSPLPLADGNATKRVIEYVRMES